MPGEDIRPWVRIPLSPHDNRVAILRPFFVSAAEIFVFLICVIFP